MTPRVTPRRLTLALVPLAVFAIRLVIPGRGFDVLGPRAGLDAALAILLAAWLLALAMGAGCWWKLRQLPKTHDRTHSVQGASDEYFPAIAQGHLAAGPSEGSTGVAAQGPRCSS